MIKILLVLSLAFLVVSCQDESSEKTDKNLLFTDKSNIKFSGKK